MLVEKLQNLQKLLQFCPLNFGALGKSPDQFVQAVAPKDFLKTKKTYYFCFYLVVLGKWAGPASMAGDSSRDAFKAGW